MLLLNCLEHCFLLFSAENSISRESLNSLSNPDPVICHTRTIPDLGQDVRIYERKMAQSQNFRQLGRT